MLDNKSNLSNTEQEEVTQRGLEMNTKVKPLSNLERTALILCCLYSEIGKRGLSAGEIAKFVNRYGKGSATVYQTNNSLNELVEKKSVIRIEERYGNGMRNRYALTILGVLDTVLLLVAVPEPIALKIRPDFSVIEDAAYDLFRAKAEVDK